MLIAIPGAAFSVLVLIRDTRALFYVRRRFGAWRETLYHGAGQGMLPAASKFFSYLLVMLLLTVILGQKIALPAFLGAYLWGWGGYSRRFSLA